MLPLAPISPLLPYTTLFRSPTDEPTRKTDGQRLAEALGIDHRALQHLRFTDRLEVREAQALNTALWPATIGYFLEEMLRSEEHTSELQSRGHLVCRLLLEKK